MSGKRLTACAFAAAGILASGAPASATVLEFDGNYFEYVSDPFVRWADAKTAADAVVYDGHHGYLAVVTSAAENNFLATNFSIGSPTFAGAWLGGEVNASDSGIWEDGPLTGVQFSQGQASFGGNYSNWGGVEPNNAPSAVYMSIGPGGPAFKGEWLDAENGVAAPQDPVQGYIVEIPVPEPSTWAVIVLGLFGTGIMLRNRRRQSEALA